MKFMLAKKDNLCYRCETVIFRGKEMVVNYPLKGHRSIMVFHPECYLLWHETLFNRKWQEFREYTGHPEAPAPLGRPTTYKEPTKNQALNRLYSLISYHKGLGHDKKVQILEQKLKLVHQKYAQDTVSNV